MKKSFNFDDLSGEYQARYNLCSMQRTKSFINNLIHKKQPSKICELGCGTCYWCGQINFPNCKVYGVDISKKMLNNSPDAMKGKIVCGDITALPLKSHSFDFYFMVNVIHLIRDKDLIFSEVYRSLKRGGLFAVIFADVHDEQYKNYLFDYFEGTKKRSLIKMPTLDQLGEWFEKNFFSDVKSEDVEIVKAIFKGREVFNDPFLRKNGSSTLAVLSKDKYDEGIQKINTAVKNDEHHLFESRIVYKAVYGRKH